MASIDRTAYPRFKRVVSARELAESFTPTAEEITWARGRTQTPGYLFSQVVLMLKCYERLGMPLDCAWSLALQLPDLRAGAVRLWRG